MEFYPFEMHTHTRHSDGSFLPSTLAESVKQEGLFGFCLTDHNATTGQDEAKLVSEKLNLVFLKGLEWTTFHGHITILGGKSSSDYRKINPNTVVSEIRRVQESGDVAVLAHPCRPGSPFCSGCFDDFLIEDYDVFDGFEVWSGFNPHTSKINKNAEERYDKLCEEGCKMAVMYGRDWHGPRNKDQLVAATYIGLKTLNSEEVLNAIKERRTYISIGVRANIQLKDSFGKVAEVGEEVTAGTYTIICRLQQELAPFAPENVSVDNIVLSGTAIDERTETKVSYGGFAKILTLKPGFLKVEIFGEINGEKAKVLFATPFFVR
ncbi:MAG TPA: CehA/McbA family metallohydrolase [Clostridia bacterium]|jgi:hypothetical protein|nr:CehA/McbA family metallohydrolase [Clostridia bacterium]